MKMQRKLHGEKRQMKDFVKPARSENVLYRQQVDTLEDTIRIIERDNEWLLKAGDAEQLGDDQSFNREEYQRLKQQIKQRKQTKEKIIAQGFPEFEAYSRF